MILAGNTPEKWIRHLLFSPSLIPIAVIKSFFLSGSRKCVEYQWNFSLFYNLPIIIIPL
jgi:hypothetical protein